jgi:hypothetical protein
MHPELAALMAAQHGLATRAQVLAHGIDADGIQRRLRSEEWVAVRWGVYALASVVQGAAGVRDRRLLVDRAVSMQQRRPHVMSHDSAALELGMAILTPPRPLTHVTRPGLVGSHVRRDIKHHLAPYSPDQVVTVNGRRVLDPARTAADVAREHPLEYGVVACDSARRMGCSLDDLWAAVAAMRNWPYVTRVREAVELSDDGADSLAETLSRMLVTELGFGRPRTQFGITDGRRTAWCDLLLGRHVIEFDGRVKYRRVDEGGVALVQPDEVLWREKQRQDWLCGFKLGISRLVWSDLWGDARVAAMARLRREYLETVRLYGTSIDDLARFIIRGPRPRPRPDAA